jgi:predicted DsbA family dithiol-disulfide isomerase
VRAVIYTDLNCPFCYATEARIAALGAEDEVEWRGVEHEPDLPVPMDPSDAELAAELGEEVDSVRSRAPEVPIAVPESKPNTGLGLHAVAAALRADPQRGAAFRRAVYAAYWRDGADISDPAVLAVIAAQYGFDELEPRHEDEVQVASWRLAWERGPRQGVPLIVRDDGDTLYGLKDQAEIERFLRA